MARDYTKIRNRHKLGVKLAEGGILQGQTAREFLNMPMWPDCPFKDNIPTLVALPPHIVWNSDTRRYDDNPDYMAALAMQAQQKEWYKNALTADYPTCRLVLLAFNAKLRWFELDEPDNPVYKGWVDMTILWPKWKAIRQLTK